MKNNQNQEPGFTPNTNEAATTNEKANNNTLSEEVFAENATTIIDLEQQQATTASEPKSETETESEMETEIKPEKTSTQQTNAQMVEEILRDGVPFPKRKELPPILRWAADRTNTPHLDPAVCQALCAVLPVCLKRGVKYKALDGQERSPNIISLITGLPASGKTFSMKVSEEFIRKIANLNTVERAKLTQWKVKYAKALATKGGKLPVKPKVDARIAAQSSTSASLLEDLINVEGAGRILLCSAPELNLLAGVGGSTSAFANNVRLFFDNGTSSASRATTAGVSGFTQAIATISVAATPGQLNQYLGKKNTDGGLTSRICTLNLPPSSDINQPVMKPFDAAFYDTANMYIDKLDAVPSGLYNTPELNRWAQKERKLLADYFRETNDQIVYSASHRLLTSAMSVGLCLQLADGGWSKAIARYLHFFFWNALRTMMQIWGPTLIAIYQHAQSVLNGQTTFGTKTGRPSRITQMPTDREFTLDEIIAARKADGLGDDPAGAINEAKNWVRQKKIVRTGKHRWRRTEQ